MKVIAILGFAALLSGCALFDQGALPAPRTASQSDAPAKAARVPFRPAFSVGRPVALVPCKQRVALSGDCRSLKVRHEVGGEMPAGATSKAFTEASTKAAPE